MAKRQNKFDFAAFRKDLLANASPNRTIETEAERQYFLIVCEGEKTEPNYFKALIETLPPQLVEVKIVGEGLNTLDVVRQAIKLREARKATSLKPDFDEIWAVFDKDSFPNQHFNAAIDLGKNENINTAYSNEAFELWYILHFQLLETAISRHQYIDILKGILGNYEKNAKNIYRLLQENGNEEDAIKNAERLLKIKNCGNPALEVPTTKVHELVMRLNEFKT